jgi:hypothetical protein
VSRKTLYAVAAALLAADLGLHKRVSDVCDALAARLGFAVYDRVALGVLVGASTLGGALVAVRERARPRPWALAALAALSLGAERALLVAHIELVHFPQYAVLSGLLVLAGVAPERAFVVATLGGIVDESYQHLVIYAGRPGTYLDFNDMLLNALGAAWGVVLLAPRAPSTPRSGRAPAWAALGALAALAVWPPAPPLWRRAASGRFYHLLSAGEAVALGVATWLVVRSCRRQDPV